MALKATLRRAVKAAFTALDDIPRKVTYHVKTGTPIRDLDAGTFTLTTVNVALPMVALVRFKQKDLDKNPAIVASNMKALIPTEDLKGRVPATADTFTDDTGTTWEVVQLLSDPAEVITILEVRS